LSHALTDLQIQEHHESNVFHSKGVENNLKGGVMESETVKQPVPYAHSVEMERVTREL
jgi:hypothetical protein